MIWIINLRNRKDIEKIDIKFQIFNSNVEYYFINIKTKFFTNMKKKFF